MELFPFWIQKDYISWRYSIKGPENAKETSLDLEGLVKGRFDRQ